MKTIGFLSENGVTSKIGFKSEKISNSFEVGPTSKTEWISFQASA
ncbi:hypothetical protein LEP1GSC193_3185 [Leptospira alstonii serovar Pingchang str. 80-412]|uniref:Uncharacterized protein n=2 Tax=Leptospira alstonii TaxID=28452 RepID=M6D0Z6_9LEPT|nr:hypothetical protein LEP1GSC194_2964 [Leptospira alstonii serovar Sichuan str. 79601]EQA79365.1 hypothetical protein LEP1GSC193_3185 [Leptospira alstonii serovar Pingchang str. 80-412]